MVDQFIPAEEKHGLQNVKLANLDHNQTKLYSSPVPPVYVYVYSTTTISIKTTTTITIATTTKIIFRSSQWHEWASS